MEWIDHRALWDQATALLREDMPDVSYKTWIEPSTPFALEADTLYLEVASDFVRNTIMSRYQALIANAVGDRSSRRLHVEYLTAQERIDRFGPSGLPGVGPAIQANGSGGSGMLNPRYTFDTFVVGNANRFAKAASVAVAEAPGNAYNPLFIYGGVGLGKTHLMHAIGHEVAKRNPGQRQLYVTSENFTNELITAIQTNKTIEFRDRYRNLDLLMIDDIQFIATKERTQEEFFHTFNTLHAAGKQIIITSDKPPKEIARLEERLCSRFEWGLIADIQRPDLETRIAILRQKKTQVEQTEGIDINDDVLDTIANMVESNIRELEGSLARIVAYAALENRPVTAELASEALAPIRAEPRRVTSEMIQNAVAAYYGIEVAELKGQKRNREIMLPRQVAMYLIREMIDLSYPLIGHAFGGRDHTTVMHSCTKIGDMVRSKGKVAQEMDDVRKSLQSRN
ncbi:MAG: chromosomal replication initiator protein DnaA [Clostridia bacterium]|nr:chromosomal replication initiator protein DnaA [Clostridia bacterium]